MRERSERNKHSDLVGCGACGAAKDRLSAVADDVTISADVRTVL